MSSLAIHPSTIRALGLVGAALLLALLTTLAAPSPLHAQTDLTPGQERAPYSVTLPLEGDEIIRVGGTLPFGLYLYPDGTLSGIPSYPGTYEFTARADGPSGRERATFRVEIAPWQWVTELVGCGWTTYFPLNIDARAGERIFDLDKPEAALFYSVTLPPDIGAVTLSLVSEDGGDAALLLPRASFGAGSAEIYTYSIIEDHLGDEHLHLTDGTPEYSLEYYRAEGILPITVAGVTPGIFSLSMECSIGVGGGPEALPNGVVGQAYHGEIFAYSGAPPFVFEAEGLPSGLSLDGATGVISGTPSASGRFPLALKVTDSAGGEDSWSASLWIPEVLSLECGESLLGDFDAKAFPWEEGLRTPGGVAFVEVPSLGEGVSGLTLTLRGGAGGDYSPMLYLGEPGAPLGESAFEGYASYVFDEGAGASLTLDDASAPWLGSYGDISMAVASAGGVGSFELGLTCETDLAMAPFVANPPLNEPYTAILQARGEGADTLTWAVIDGSLPEGLSLDEQSGVIAGTATGGGGEVVIEGAGESGRVERAYRLIPGEGACGGVEMLECGDYVLGELEAEAWVNRVSLDLSVPGGVDFYCIVPAPETSVVEVTLSPISGSNADLLGGWPGVVPGSQDARYYGLFSALDGEDQLKFEGDDYPGWATSAPIALAVPAFEGGSYTLEVLCD